MSPTSPRMRANGVDSVAACVRTSGAPSEVTPRQLREQHIRLALPAKSK